MFVIEDKELNISINQYRIIKEVSVGINSRVWMRIHSFIHSFIHLVFETPSFIHLFIQFMKLLHSLIHSFTHSLKLIHSFSKTHSFIHSVFETPSFTSNKQIYIGYSEKDSQYYAMKSINKHMKSIRANSKLYRFWGNNAIDVGLLIESSSF